MPGVWKSSIIKPIPKKPGSKELNDFHPVALTPVLAKCMERVVTKHLTASLNLYLDPLQFACKPHRGTEDATLTMVNMVSKHLQNTNTYVQILFVDFTAAFNTMQVIFLQRLTDLGVDGDLVHWIKHWGTCDVLCPSHGHMSTCNGMNVFILCTICVLYTILTSETKDNFHAGHDNSVFSSLSILFYSMIFVRQLET